MMLQTSHDTKLKDKMFNGDDKNGGFNEKFLQR